MAQLVEQSLPRFRDPRFKSKHWQNFIYQLYIEKEKTKIKKKRLRMGHLKKIPCLTCFSSLVLGGWWVEIKSWVLDLTDIYLKKICTVFNSFVDQQGSKAWSKRCIYIDSPWRLPRQCTSQRSRPRRASPTGRQSWRCRPPYGREPGEVNKRVAKIN